MMQRGVRSAVVLALAFAFVGYGRAEAKIVGVTVTKREPFAAGTAFGAVGSYTRIDGTARGELDPADPRNAVIDGIGLAPRNARGMVEYETDFSILTPAQPANGSATIVYDVPNRGRKFLLPWLLDAPSAAGAINDPASAADAGTALAFRRGYTIVWSGWNFYATPYPAGELCDREGIFVPFARTTAERTAAGDPRPSLAERYATPPTYLQRFTAAADALVREHLLLREDADRMIETAAQVTF
jgi:hypothetical protein